MSQSRNEDGTFKGADDESFVPAPTSRVQQLDRIADRAFAALERSNEDAPDFEPDPALVEQEAREKPEAKDEKPEGEQGAAEGAEDTQEGAAAAGADTKADEGEKKPETPPADPEVILVVDGREVKMPQSKAFQLAQKNLAADARLGEASRLLREAQAYEASLREQKGLPAGAPSPVQQAKQDDDAEALARALQFGNEAQAAEAIRRLRQGGVSQDVLERFFTEALPQIEARATEAAVQRIERTTAKRSFEAENADLLNDPIKRRVMFAFDDQLIAEAQAIGAEPDPDAVRWKAAAKKAREWLKANAPAAAGEPTEGQQKGLEGRKQAKAETISHAGNTGSRQVAKPPPKEETVQDAIAQIRQMRHQGRRVI